jgi:lysozyme
MIRIIEILAGLLKSKIGKLIGFIILIGVLIFFIINIKGRRSSVSKLPVISMLESVQKMERLELLTYNSNELLVLGDPDVLEKMVEKATADSSKTWEIFHSTQMELEKYKVELQTLRFNQKTFKKNILQVQKGVDSCQQQYDILGKEFLLFRKKAEKKSATEILSDYGKSIAVNWTAYTNHEQEEKKEKGRRAKKQARKNTNASKEELHSAWLSQRKTRYSGLEAAQNMLKAVQKDEKHATHTKLLKHLLNEINNSEENLSKQKMQLQDARTRIKNLRESIDKKEVNVNSTLNVKNAKLLAILPTKTLFYLDINTIDITIKEDSMVYITIDSIHHDPVYVQVDSSVHFNIAKRKVEITSDQDGLYFEVFNQLQTGIEVIEERVELKLQSTNLKETALKKARSYFQGIYHALGYKVSLHIGAASISEVKVVKTIENKISKTRKEKVDAAKPIVHQKKDNQSAAAHKDISHKKLSSHKKEAPRNGIDVSHFNGDIDWNKVKSQNISFAYAKATQGISFNDPKFQQNWNGIKASGMQRGAYHFYVPSDGPEKQAHHFIEQVGELAEGDLLPMLDVEDTDMGNISNSEFQKDILTWLNIVENHYKVKPIVYTYTSYANQYLTRTEFSDYKLWIAEYTNAKSPILPNSWKEEGWYMWQFISHDKLNGINGFVDCDRTSSLLSK